VSGNLGSVLLVDDDDELREAIGELLRFEGFEVSAVRHGHEALEALRSRPLPRVIVLDLMMPVMNGEQFRTEQLGAPGLAGVPVVVMSAAYDGRKRAEAMGASDYFSKPIDFDAFVAALRRYC
jgi:CheY-like chemotaxis protein